MGRVVDFFVGGVFVVFAGGFEEIPFFDVVF
jgi:hypothetical protein